MVRYPDILKVYRHTGDIYNPFAESEGEVEEGPVIGEELVYEGDCNHELSSQNHMMSVADKGTYTIIVPDIEADIDSRDTAFLYLNSVGQPLKLTILEVTPYCRNLVIHAMHLKDGDNEEPEEPEDDKEKEGENDGTSEDEEVI